MRAPIDETLVRRLVDTQFPQWTHLALRPVLPGGWDNRIFRLGEDLLVRLPSAPIYALQVEKEQRWLPKLAPLLPLAVPTPVAMGVPGDEYAWKWSIYRWLDGEPAAIERIDDPAEFATRLAEFLLALQRIDAADGPTPGPHNFHRGGSLGVYDAQTRQAIARLQGRVDTAAAMQVWEVALATPWQKPPVWIHGDVSPGNLLVRRGRLDAVIDFGMLGVGDPACDLSIAWTLLAGDSREAFRMTLGCDSDTWSRGRGWALWKALIVAAGSVESNAPEAGTPCRVIDEVLEDHQRGLKL